LYGIREAERGLNATKEALPELPSILLLESTVNPNPITVRQRGILLLLGAMLVQAGLSDQNRRRNSRIVGFYTAAAPHRLSEGTVEVVAASLPGFLLGCGAGIRGPHWSCCLVSTTTTGACRQQGLFDHALLCAARPSIPDPFDGQCLLPALLLPYTEPAIVVV